MGSGEFIEETWRLADGSEVSGNYVPIVLLSVEAMLEQYGSLAAVDLVDLANGRQPASSPFGDMKPVYVEAGFCQSYSDGSIRMHDMTADVVRNALHVNPRDVLEYQVIDPRETFPGFNSSQP